MAARPLRIVVLVIVAFAAGLLLARLLVPAKVDATADSSRRRCFPAPRALPALDLVDQDGKPLPPRFFDGHWTLVFFGFTQCPDICPTTLATLAQANKQFADLPAESRPRMLLVSVDPERDPPSILAPYVRFFDPAFLAATGTSRGHGRRGRRIQRALRQGCAGRRWLHARPRLGHLRRRADRRHRRLPVGTARRGADRAQCTGASSPGRSRSDDRRRPPMPAPPTAPSPCCRTCCPSTCCHAPCTRSPAARQPWLRNALIGGVLRAYPQIDLGEAADPDPYAYPSFNAFFTRELRRRRAAARRRRARPRVARGRHAEPARQGARRAAAAGQGRALHRRRAARRRGRRRAATTAAASPASTWRRTTTTASTCRWPGGSPQRATCRASSTA